MRRWLRHPVLRQGGAYGVVGGVELLVDWAVYVALSHLGLAVAASNLVARASGAVLGFTLNGALTFRGPEGARLGWRRLAKFLLVWLLTTLVSTAAMVWIDASQGLAASWLAKPVVDLALALVGFLASRHWVYR